MDAVNELEPDVVVNENLVVKHLLCQQGPCSSVKKFRRGRTGPLGSLADFPPSEPLS